MEPSAIREWLKSIVAVVMLTFLLALVVHPVSAVGMALIALLFVPILFWMLEPLWSAVARVQAEERLPLTVAIRPALFQRPPPFIL